MNGQHRRVKINETGIFVLNTNFFFFEVMENGVSPKPMMLKEPQFIN